MLSKINGLQNNLNTRDHNIRNKTRVAKNKLESTRLQGNQNEKSCFFILVLINFEKWKAVKTESDISETINHEQISHTLKTPIVKNVSKAEENEKG